MCVLYAHLQVLLGLKTFAGDGEPRREVAYVWNECLCARGRGTSRGPAHLARLRCLAQSVDPNNFCW